jgi:hypothetical protein
MSQLETVLRRHGVDVSSLALVFSREDEHIYQIVVPAHSAVEQWRKLRLLTDESGYWPVVGWGSRWLGEDETYADHLLGGASAQILGESWHVDLARWREARVAEYVEVLQEDEESEEAPDDPFYDIHGRWPDDVEPYTEFDSPTSAAVHGPIPMTPIALVPAAEGWQVPAVLRFDRGYAYPPHVHVAMLRHWSEQYGAELVCMLPDLMEMQVARPPTTREAALVLAEEQFIYCQDIVIQGTQTIEALAAGLLHGTVWFFWWD